MEEKELKKKEEVLNRLEETDHKVAQVMSRKQQELMLKREMEALKREDREETVQRIAKINEYQKQLMQEKIQADDLKAK
jgi:Lon protease-like protein